MRRGVALMVQVHRGYPARPGKTPEMSDWQPIYRFSRQRYAGSPGIRERRARGRCGEPGVLPTDPRRPRGAFWRTAVVLTRSRWWWRNPHRPEPDALAGCRPVPFPFLRVDGYGYGTNRQPAAGGSA